MSFINNLVTIYFIIDVFFYFVLTNILIVLAKFSILLLSVN